MSDREQRNHVRRAAREYEQRLSSEQRKKLGQFFSGVRLGKLLAHLSLSRTTRSVLDPMAGHGDLLDATWEAADELETRIEHLEGIEIDPAIAAICRDRLAQILKADKSVLEIVVGDAFSTTSIAGLSLSSYDLVIANPPYVRYQMRADDSGSDAQIRKDVIRIADTVLSASESVIWRSLAKGYSGLADLSVPAWLLAGMMVKPGGRLALVAPSTWRSRNYADVIRYLLLRCFELELIVEDQQPGWFSDALVRTQLIVARRLPRDECARAVGRRTEWKTALSLQVAPEAADDRSLVGSAFPDDCPERAFAAWFRAGCSEAKRGITVRQFDLEEEWVSLRTQAAGRHWYHRLERDEDGLPLFAADRAAPRLFVPDALKDVLPFDFAPESVVALEDAGIQVGQGLRTGCNLFFYVTAIGPSEPGFVRVRTSTLFDESELDVPESILIPVVRRQAEMHLMETGGDLEGRVLDLREWVLPEDVPVVNGARAVYESQGKAPARVMPRELAAYVQKAAGTKVKDGTYVRELSAVRTNVRAGRASETIPRFWYMLPDFAPRHIPAAFVARVNSGLPWAMANREPRVLVDANFSTFWSPSGNWSGHALKALLNSAWCRAFMEATGTPLGGGALKLEATHLRRMPIPALSNDAKVELDLAGRKLTRTADDVQAHIDRIILDELLTKVSSRLSSAQLANAMTSRAETLSVARRKVA